MYIVWKETPGYYKPTESLSFQNSVIILERINMYQLLYSNNKDLKHRTYLILPFSFYCVTYSSYPHKEQALSSVMWLAGLGRLVPVRVLGGVVCGCWGDMSLL